MPKDASLENDPILQALGYQPWQVDGSIDADRSEGSGAVNSWLQFGLWEDSKLLKILLLE